MTINASKSGLLGVRWSAQLVLLLMVSLVLAAAIALAVYRLAGGA